MEVVPAFVVGAQAEVVPAVVMEAQMEVVGVMGVLLELVVKQISSFHAILLSVATLFRPFLMPQSVDEVICQPFGFEEEMPTLGEGV